MKIDAKSILLSTILSGLAILGVSAAPGPLEADGPYAPSVVVIDPGHGGIDEGVKGPSGKSEKALMLELARKIKARLVPDLDVRLTRDDDYQVTLIDRTAVANTNRAALLVSLHSGASFTSHAGHVTVYLYEAPTDTTSLESAAGDPLRPDWQWQHQQSRHLKESQRLGKLIARQLNNLPTAFTVTSQNARLPVLAGADLPAVMMEFGDLSSAAGEERLSSAEWQQKVAGAVAAAVRLFISGGDR
jgi:N-acetylmuramoyl-L-alanine amidase